MSVRLSKMNLSFQVLFQLIGSEQTESGDNSIHSIPMRIESLKHIYVFPIPVDKAVTNY